MGAFEFRFEIELGGGGEEKGFLALSTIGEDGFDVCGGGGGDKDFGISEDC